MEDLKIIEVLGETNELLRSISISLDALKEIMDRIGDEIAAINGLMVRNAERQMQKDRGY